MQISNTKKNKNKKNEKNEAHSYTSCLPARVINTLLREQWFMKNARGMLSDPSVHS